MWLVIFECFHWLKLQHSGWRANLVKDFLFKINFPPIRLLKFITGHMIYKPAYTYKFQLKTTKYPVKISNFDLNVSKFCNPRMEAWQPILPQCMCCCFSTASDPLWECSRCTVCVFHLLVKIILAMFKSDILQYKFSYFSMVKNIFPH